MKALERKGLNEQITCRKNIIGFLHHEDIAKLNKLFNGFYDVNGKAFKDICQKAFELYASKALTSEECLIILKTCIANNTSFRQESHRYSYGDIYEYDTQTKSYIFICRGNKRYFNSLNHYLD